MLYFADQDNWVFSISSDRRERDSQWTSALYCDWFKGQKKDKIAPPPWYWSSAVFWRVYLWTPNFLSFSLIISTCPSKIFFSNFFQSLWENWPRMTKTKKSLVPKNEKTCFFFKFFRKKTSNIISKLNDDFSEDYLRYYTFLYRVFKHALSNFKPLIRHQKYNFKS